MDRGAYGINSTVFRRRAPAPARPPTSPEHGPPHGALAALRWVLTRRPARWPRWREVALGPPPPHRVAAGELRYTVVNHSTVLLQADGCNLLFDPIWSRRCSPVPFAGPRRVHAPALRLGDLPPLDAVLVSHNHYDHCDRPTLRRLAAAPAALAIPGVRNGALLRAAGFAAVRELGWWQETEVGGLGVRYVPARHFSGRGVFDRNRCWWGGFVVRRARGSVYFAGDTGWSGGMFAELRARCGAPALAFLPIGAYAPRWFMAPVHLDPEAAVRAHRALGAGSSVAIHHGTFQLTDEAIDDPVDELERARLRHGVDAAHFSVPVLGRGYALLD